MSISASGGNSNLMDNGNAWDDAELIRAYNKAVKGWRRTQAEQQDQEGYEEAETPGPGPWIEVSTAENVEQLTIPVAVPIQHNSPTMLEVGSWIVGAPCRALYSEDGLEYEAKIVGIEGPNCKIRFVGYGNEEQVYLVDLKTTHGKKSRDKQRREAIIYHQNYGGDRDFDCLSNVSLTSSLYNNYTDSVCRDRDVEDTLTEAAVLQAPRQTSTPRIGIAKSQLKVQGKTLQKIKLGGGGDFTIQSETVDNMDSAIPSAAEATIDSSSEISFAAGDEPQEATTTELTNGVWENFNNTMPQFKFPVPPIPLSLSKKDGGFDFGRGELPALLMSWYMAGYQAGFFDAKRELSGSTAGNRVPKSSKRMN